MIRGQYLVHDIYLLGFFTSNCSSTRVTRYSRKMGHVDKTAMAPIVEKSQVFVLSSVNGGVADDSSPEILSLSLSPPPSAEESGKMGNGESSSSGVQMNSQYDMVVDHAPANKKAACWVGLSCSDRNTIDSASISPIVRSLYDSCGFLYCDDGDK